MKVFMQYFIAYFPYLNMKDADEVDFGFAKVWNFDKKKDEYIPNPQMKAKIEGLLAVYTSEYKRPVRNIGIISIGTIDFQPFEEKDREVVRLIRLILFICFISHNNTVSQNPNSGHQMATSENFDVIFQSFLLDSDYLSERGGEVVGFLKGGFKASEMNFQTPTYVPSSYRFILDAELFGLLLRMKKEKQLVFKKIINAVEIFLESYFNTHQLSKNARILLQMSAFEILLDLPENKGQREAFKEVIEKYALLPEDTKKYETHWSRKERNPNNPKHIQEFLSIKGIWAESFYLLRNSIIHGNTPLLKSFAFKNGQPHIHISTLFFVLSIRKQIEKSLKSYKCLYEIKWKTWTDEISDAKPFKRTEFVYEKSFRYLWSKMVKIRSRKKRS